MDFRYNSAIKIPLDHIKLDGVLTIPADAKSIVIFSHGSGSSHLSVRNRLVSQHLLKHNLGTLLFDLLTPKEDQDYTKRFNIDLLTERLTNATQWLELIPEAKDCSLGYFGASTGAASALNAAALLPQKVNAVVSRGGRPDLARLPDKVKAPTLLIVGSLDKEVLELNKKAFGKLPCEKKLEVVEGATHLFEEPGKMDEVIRLATDWFKKYLRSPLVSV